MIIQPPGPLVSFPAHPEEDPSKVITIRVCVDWFSSMGQVRLAADGLSGRVLRAARGRYMVETADRMVEDYTSDHPDAV